MARTSGVLKNMVAALERLLLAEKIDRVIDWALGVAKTHPQLVAIISFYLLLALICLALFWIWPLAIWYANERLGADRKVKLKWLGDLEVSAANLLIFGLIRYHRRVLDAWISSQMVTARIQLHQKRIVREHAIHISVPIQLDGATYGDLTPEHLRSVFAHKSARLLVLGEGGAGKTSIACQVADWALADDPKLRPAAWPMLPVIIEQDLNLESAKARTSLIEVIRGQLKELLELGEAPPEDLVVRLLVRQRALVIVDGLSELNDDTRNSIRPISPQFPANALILTSRLEEPLDGISKSILRPLRIKGERLSSFMEAYLLRRGERELFDDAEFFESCRKLSVLVAGRDATVLLARLFADQTIACKKNGSTLPETIPDLMLQYVNEINRNQRGMSDSAVQTAAKRVAWASLSETFRPQPARVEDVMAALGYDKYEAQIDYLEHKLKIVEVMGAKRRLLRLTIEPIAEYLAALHLIDEIRDDETAWNDFLGRADCAPGAPEAIKGFLFAVRDCCLASDWEIPSFVISEIERRVGFDAALIQELHRKQRASEAITRLASPFPDDRAAAAVALGKFGAGATPMVRGIAGALKDLDVEVRKSAVASLASMGIFAGPALLALVGASLDPSNGDLRLDALRAANIIARACGAPDLLLKMEHSNLHPRNGSLFTAVVRQFQIVYSARPDAIGVLVDALEDESVCEMAHQVIMGLGPQALMAASLADQEKYLQELQRLRETSLLENPETGGEDLGTDWTKPPENPRELGGGH
jgi:HEAT repeat protein